MHKINLKELENDTIMAYDNHNILVRKIYTKINFSENIYFINTGYFPNNIIINSSLLLYITDFPSFVYSSFRNNLEDDIILYGNLPGRIKLFVDNSNILKENEFDFFNNVNQWKKDMQKRYRKQKLTKILK